jgi:hypothetical protein
MIFARGRMAVALVSRKSQIVAGYSVWLASMLVMIDSMDAATGAEPTNRFSNLGEHHEARAKLATIPERFHPGMNRNAG